MSTEIATTAPRLVSADEAADLLGCAPAEVLRMAREFGLRWRGCQDAGGRISIQFDAEEIEAFAEALHGEDATALAPRPVGPATPLAPAAPRPHAGPQARRQDRTLTREVDLLRRTVEDHHRRSRRTNRRLLYGFVAAVWVALCVAGGLSLHIFRQWRDTEVAKAAWREQAEARAQAARRYELSMRRDETRELRRALEGLQRRVARGGVDDMEGCAGDETTARHNEVRSWARGLEP